jgi:hypothetical protein
MLMSKVLKVLMHPVTQVNICLIGFLCMIELIHLHAHHKMDLDVHGYVHNYCRKNRDACESLLDR